MLLTSLPVHAAEIGKSVATVNTNSQVSVYNDFAQGYYKVVGTGVRMRSEAGLSGGIIATLSYGELLFSERAAGPIVDKDGYRWMRCERVSNGQIGYVAMDYVQSVPAPTRISNHIVNWK